MPREDEDDLKSSKITKKGEHIQAKLNQVFMIQYCHFGKENKCQGHFKELMECLRFATEL